MIPWILAIIFVEAITEIIVQSEIFFSLRNFIARTSAFLGNLISCGYCTSVWVSAIIGWALPGNVLYLWMPNTTTMVIDCILKIFVLHRISNVLHEAFSRWFSRLPFSLVVNKIDPGDIDDEDEDG